MRIYFLASLLAVELKACNRIFVSCLEGRVDTEEDAYAEADETSRTENLPGDMWCEWRNERDEEGEDVTENEAHKTANYAKNDGFEEELEEDVACACADCLADTNLAGALRNGDEHDIHDADTTDDERDAGDEGEHVRNDREKGAGWMKVVGARDNLVILVALLGLAELLVDSVDSVWNDIGGLSADIDLLNLNRRLKGAGEVDIDKDRVIEIYAVEVDWIFELIENTDDHELLVVIGESAGGCFGGAEDLFCDVIAENSDVLAKAIVEELTALEAEAKDVLKVVVSSNDSGGLVSLAGNRDGGTADSDWGDGFYLVDLFDSSDILDSEVRFGILASVG